MSSDRNFLRKRKNEHRSFEALTSTKESTKKSPKLEYGNEIQLSGHSTPIRKTDTVSGVEVSPDVDNGCSPILLPCTQDCNEIAWDWQSSGTRSKETSNRNNLTETPKRNKLLSTKRTINSPLLQKRLQRKVKTDNIEEWAAELKALTEGIYNAQQNEEHQCSKEEENLQNEDSDTQLLVVLDTLPDNTTLNVPLNNNKVNRENIAGNTENQKVESYDELFDDSIDDSMMKCSQAIEERLNADLRKSLDLSSDNSNGGTKLGTSKNSTGSSNSFPQTSPRMNVSNCLKTYSKNPAKPGSSTNIRIDRLPSCHQFRNNITKVDAGKANNKSKSSDGMKSDLFEIPDDSFDDCLATCIESEKLLSKVSDTDDTLQTNTTNSSKSNSDTSSSKTSNESNTATGTRASMTTTISMENRKFFKTRSLSDQCFTKTGKAAYASKSSYSANQTRLHAGSSVNGIHSAAKPSNHYQTSSVNEKESNNRFTKHKSANNLATKATSFGFCTPEEIERKRLEAKMRQEAKRKLQKTMQTVNSQSEIPLKRPVKR